MAYGNVQLGFALMSASNNTLASNAGCGNGLVDAYQDNASVGDVFTNNTFCTVSGIDPPAASTTVILSSPRRSG